MLTNEGIMEILNNAQVVGAETSSNTDSAYEDLLFEIKKAVLLAVEGDLDEEHLKALVDSFDNLSDRVDEDIQDLTQEAEERGQSDGYDEGYSDAEMEKADEISELEEKVEELENDVDDLEYKVSELHDEVNDLMAQLEEE